MSEFEEKKTGWTAGYLWFEPACKEGMENWLEGPYALHFIYGALSRCIEVLITTIQNTQGENEADHWKRKTVGDLLKNATESVVKRN